MTTPFSRACLKPLAQLFLGTASAALLPSIALAEQVCLIAPNNGAIFVRTEFGSKTGESWRGRTLAEVWDASEGTDGGTYVEVSVDGKLGWVSKSVVQPSSACRDVHPSPDSPTYPNPDTPKAPNPVVPQNYNSANPADCGTGSAAQGCIKSALSEYANKGRRSLGYDRARFEIFQKIDVMTDNRGRRVVDSVYSDDFFPVGNGVPSDSTGVNTEHTWPQSRLKEHQGRFGETRSDIYHLFPTEKGINSVRGNHPFKDCGHQDEQQGYLCEGNGGIGFEPPNSHKGAVARAMFYMATTYSFLDIDPAQEKVLRQWHRDHPVTAPERARCDKIEEAQGNRNPFIDNPDWVELVENF